MILTRERIEEISNTDRFDIPKESYDEFRELCRLALIAIDLNTHERSYLRVLMERDQWKKKYEEAISKKEYERLIERDLWLQALEIVGVDNWEGYSEAFEALKELEKE